MARKGPGREAKLCFAGHVLMDNRNGLVVDVQITQATGTAERDTALDMLQAVSLGADTSLWGRTRGTTQKTS